MKPLPPGRFSTTNCQFTTLLHRLRQHARGRVDRAAGRERHQHADGLVGVILAVRSRGGEHQGATLGTAS